MKMYMLFTKDSHDEKYYVFQGGFETLGDAFKGLYGMDTSKEEPGFYIIRKTTGDMVAEGTIKIKKDSPQRRRERRGKNLKTNNHTKPQRAQRNDEIRGIKNCLGRI